MNTPKITFPATGAVAGTAHQIVIATDTNFVIQLTPSNAMRQASEKPSNANIKKDRVVEFKVNKKVLSAYSTLFKDLFVCEPDMPVINIEKKLSGMGYALEIWLRAIHNGAKSIPSELKAIHSERIWLAIAVGEQFGFAPLHLDKIKPWFLDFYYYTLKNGPGLTPMIARSLAYPCSLLDHPEGFMKLTKYLVYNTNGVMFTNNPSSIRTIGVDARVLDGPLTAARAHLQSVLDKELSFPIVKLHKATCRCRKETAFDYEEALMALQCWPLDFAMSKLPLAEIMDELNKFEYTPKVTNCESGVCRHDFKKSVSIAISRTKNLFDGLCLDCIERSKPTDDVSKEEYMKKNSPDMGCWDMNCRFGHGRPSWYYSWSGESSARGQIINEYRNESRRRPAQKDAAKKTRRAGQNTFKGPFPLNVPGVAVKNQATTPAHARQPAPRTSINSDKENNGYHCHEADDEDEFFDAEDDYTQNKVESNGNAMTSLI